MLNTEKCVVYYNAEQENGINTHGEYEITPKHGGSHEVRFL